MAGPPAPRTFKSDILRRATVYEAELIELALAASSPKYRDLFRDVQYLDHDDARFAMVRSGFIDAFGEARADELLAPSEWSTRPAAFVGGKTFRHAINHWVTISLRARRQRCSCLLVKSSGGAGAVEQFQRRDLVEPRHSPAYVAQIGREWRIVVPIRGKLCPKLATPMFLAREAAELWLRSSDGQQCVVRLRERPQRAHLVGNADPSLAAAPLALAVGV